MQQDIVYIKEALRLAKKGLGKTFPNPMVGAVIVKNNTIIAKGYHQKAGLAHAEIEAIRHTRRPLASLTGATLYVNLEPCSHFGKTPPCTKEIIKAGIKRVVCATLDPNPKVQGKGIIELRKAGIRVASGVLEHEAQILNEHFFFFHTKKRPFITIKFAASLDGKIATKAYDAEWITNEKARLFARQIRTQYQAILVGINTVIRDNPHLGTQTRIILDSHLRIPLESNVLRDTNVLIATTKSADKEKKDLLEKKGATVITFTEKNIPLKSLIDELARREIISVFVEGGGQVLGSFIDEKLVDKVYAFHAPILIGGEKGVNAVQGKGARKINEAVRLKNVKLKTFDDNILTIGYVN